MSDLKRNKTDWTSPRRGSTLGDFKAASGLSVPAQNRVESLIGKYGPARKTNLEIVRPGEFTDFDNLRIESLYCSATD